MSLLSARGVPPSALVLGLAGVLPFAYGALVAAGFPPQPSLASWLPNWNDGEGLLISYGRIILTFMSGALWGFACKASSRSIAAYLALSVIPALYVFFFGDDLKALLSGFVGILLLDILFWRVNLAPRWWLTLRFLITALVAGCFAVGIWA